MPIDVYSDLTRLNIKGHNKLPRQILEFYPAGVEIQGFLSKFVRLLRFNEYFRGQRRIIFDELNFTNNQNHEKDIIHRNLLSLGIVCRSHGYILLFSGGRFRGIEICSKRG